MASAGAGLLCLISERFWRKPGQRRGGGAETLRGAFRKSKKIPLLLMAHGARLCMDSQPKKTFVRMRKETRRGSARNVPCSRQR